MRGQPHLFEMAKERNKASTGESEGVRATLPTSKCSDSYFLPVSNQHLHNVYNSPQKEEEGEYKRGIKLHLYKNRFFL